MSLSKNYFMGLDGFVWFVGVVEDRDDPEFHGRCRVRCLGFHSPNLTDIPTSDLPWAHVMHPVTDPSMHGLGNSPSWLVEGSWVIGFFRDAVERQQPIIIGSLPGNPISSADHRKGFNDPRHNESTQTDSDGELLYAYNPEDMNKYGPYPLGGLKDTSDINSGNFSRFSDHSFGEPDTNRLARGDQSETHAALARRRKLKRSDIPTATRPHIPSVEDGSVLGTKVADPMVPWSEPPPKGLLKDTFPYTSARYPLNHVYESEAGHIIEIDDTPGGERLHREHKTGTFEEWHPTGDKVVKVIGSNYEIIAGSSNVLIRGDVNLTIEGTKKELIKGDYILEVEGDYTRKVHKNERVKIGAGESGGNLESEIKGNYSYNINNAVKGRVGKDQDVTIFGNESRTINGYFDGTIVGNYTVTSLADINISAKTNMSLKTVSGIVAISAGSNVNVRSAAAMKIKSGGVYTLQSVGAAHETYDSTYHVDYKGLNEFDHSGDWRVMKGADYYARHAAGVDYACSSDPSRTAENDCTDPTTPTLP
jgi:hypothetical protein